MFIGQWIGMLNQEKGRIGRGMIGRGMGKYNDAIYLFPCLSFLCQFWCAAPQQDGQEKFFWAVASGIEQVLLRRLNCFGSFVKLFPKIPKIHIDELHDWIIEVPSL